MENEKEERRPRVVLLALDQGKFDARRSLDELTALIHHAADESKAYFDKCRR